MCPQQQACYQDLLFQDPGLGVLRPRTWLWKPSLEKRCHVSRSQDYNQCHVMTYQNSIYNSQLLYCKIKTLHVCLQFAVAVQKDWQSSLLSIPALFGSINKPLWLNILSIWMNVANRKKEKLAEEAVLCSYNFEVQQPMVQTRWTRSLSDMSYVVYDNWPQARFLVSMWWQGLGTVSLMVYEAKSPDLHFLSGGARCCLNHCRGWCTTPKTRVSRLRHQDQTLRTE